MNVCLLTKNTYFKATLPGRFLVFSTLSCIIFAFFLGRFSRYLLLPDIQQPFVGMPVLLTADELSTSSVLPTIGTLPTPRAKNGKVVPQTIYTTKNFDTRRSALIVSQWLQPDTDESSSTHGQSFESVAKPRNGKLIFNNTDVFQYNKDEEEHYPAGQHLLVDISNVDESFLASETRLAKNMVTLVDSSGLTLLSYHCHGLHPSGVSCVGVLLESHVSFHTWPKEGVITLDLFTCGSTSLLDSISSIKELFAIPRSAIHENMPNFVWAYKRRGFKDQTSMIGSRDTFAYPLGIHGMEMKNEVASIKRHSGKQTRAYDMLPVSMRVPSRQFYLDGILQSTSAGQAAAAESFVHPPMLAHDSPKRVLLFGAGLGSNIREILKYEQVDHVTVVGSEKDIEEFARLNLAEWNDCSSVSHSENNCFDNARLQFVYNKTPMEWIGDYDGALFDVALVDLPDMEEEYTLEITSNLKTFFNNVFVKLNNDGVAGVNVAHNVRAVDSRAKGRRLLSIEKAQKLFKDELHNAGFENSFSYEENKEGFPQPRSYVVASKGERELKKGITNEAKIAIDFQARFNPVSAPELFFQLVDAATMVSYLKPSSGVEQSLATAFSSLEKTASLIAKDSNEFGEVSRSKAKSNNNTYLSERNETDDRSNEVSSPKYNLSEATPSWFIHIYGS